MNSKVTTQCERSLGNSNLRAKKPRSERELFISESESADVVSDSAPADWGSLSWFSGTIQVEEGKPSIHYLNLLLKPNNFFFRETVRRFIFDESNVSPRGVIESA